MTTPIPFVDLRAQHEEVRPEIEAAIRDIIDRSAFIGGSYVANFEREFADYLGVKEVLGVGNGTDALWLALAAMEVGADDAVITVPNTFIATTEAITRVGALPLFVDIDLTTANMDMGKLKRFLETECRREDDGRLMHLKTGKRVAAIMPVHLYGLPVDLAVLMPLAESYGLPVVEDACQAHGARYQMNGEWKRAGTFGLAAGFSFYPGKNLGAMGDAGAVVTNDSELAQKMRWLRDHGSSEKYVHITSQGWNSRLDSMQAAILSAKLKKLDDWNGRRRAAAAAYQQALAGLPLELPYEPAECEHIYHLYVVRHPDRETLRKGLSERKVGVGLHYPIPLHLQKAYETLGFGPGSYPVSEQSAAQGLSLPMHPAMTPEMVKIAADAVAEVLAVSPVK